MSCGASERARASKRWKLESAHTARRGEGSTFLIEMDGWVGWLVHIYFRPPECNPHYYITHTHTHTHTPLGCSSLVVLRKRISLKAGKLPSYTVLFRLHIIFRPNLCDGFNKERENEKACEIVAMD